MVPDKNKILSAIYGAIDIVNEALPKERRGQKTPDALLYGPSGFLDSLGMTIFVVQLEQKLQDETGAAITLADHSIMFAEQSPFRTVQTLTEHIVSRMEAGT